MASDAQCIWSYILGQGLLDEVVVCKSQVLCQDTGDVASQAVNTPKNMAAVIDRERAAIQRRARGQHARERAQDYVEAIQTLIAVYGEARATDLAKWLGVTHVTVIRTVERL